MNRDLLLDRGHGSRNILHERLASDDFVLNKRRILGVVSFSLIQALRWSSVELKSTSDGLAIFLWNGGEIGDDGYAVAEASVQDPAGVTGKSTEFFARQMSASFVAVSEIAVGSRFNCDLFDNQGIIGRLRLGTIGQIALTRTS